LKKVKKNWSHELKHVTSYYYENVSWQGERRTKNYWHSRPETHGCYVTRTMTLEWQTDCFIRKASYEAVWSIKFWNKIHGCFGNHFQKKLGKSFQVTPRNSVVKTY